MRELLSDPTNLIAILIFLAAASAAYCFLLFNQSRKEVKRRKSRLMDDAVSGQSRQSLRHDSLRVVTRLLDSAARYYSEAGENTKVLQHKFGQAGIYHPKAVALFFVSRIILALTAVAAMFVGTSIASYGGSLLWLLIAGAGIVGYLAPGFFLDRRIKRCQNEHRSGFPDFMDLLVICADSGLPLEASLERVCRELGESYPSLAANMHITNLEIRAGRTLSDALERLADRVGLPEARAFVTLIKQSIELGSSITDALRVYSEDMRHKRLSIAEEKAYALPVKLSVPMMLCIFPVLFVVILLPVGVRLYTGHY